MLMVFIIVRIEIKYMNIKFVEFKVNKHVVLSMYLEIKDVDGVGHKSSTSGLCLLSIQ